jgi:hypothetical protein
MPFFAALAGGEVALYRPLQATAGSKEPLACGKVAPVGGKVAPAGGKVAPARHKVPNFFPLPSALPTESLCLCVDVLNEKGAEEGCSSVATTAHRARVECESETKNKTVL